MSNDTFTINGLVDSLRRRNTQSPTCDPTQTLRTSRTRWARVPVWATVTGACMLSFACGVNLRGNQPEPVSAAPRAVPTVTVTVTKTVMPPNCASVLRKIQAYLTDAGKIAGTSGQQLDILNDAYVAIFSKDWKALHELEDRQRSLAGTIAGPAANLLPDLQSINQELAKCLSDIHQG